MATRATEAMVKEIINTDLTDEQVTPFLAAANTMVTDLLLGENYSTATLQEIERWLAAHFVAVRDPQVTQEKTDDAQATYEGKTGMGLNSTRYGQQAMLLDHHGILARVASSKRPAEVKTIT